jgi:hypothetical protein
MLAASIFGIFLIPMLYVVFQRLSEGRFSPARPTDDDDGDLAARLPQSPSS